MKKIIFIISLASSLLCWGQGKNKPTFWDRSQVGIEFVHNMNHAYTLGDHGLLCGNPFNALQATYSLDLGRCWTVGAFVGFRCAASDSEWNSSYMPIPPNEGMSSVSNVYETTRIRFGLEASFHFLTLLRDKDNPFDLFANALVGHTMDDLDVGLGFGFGYRPIPDIEIFGKAVWGSLGFPNGIQQPAWPRYQLRCGVSYRL